MWRIGTPTVRAFNPPPLAHRHPSPHIGVEEVPMDQRKMTEGQRAYEAKRAAKAGVSLEKWLSLKEKEAAAEREQVAKAKKIEAAAKKPGFLSRLLERVQKPL
jgi:hypothetical protein